MWFDIRGGGSGTAPGGRRVSRRGRLSLREEEIGKWALLSSI